MELLGCKDEITKNKPSVAFVLVQIRIKTNSALAVNFIKIQIKIRIINRNLNGCYHWLGLAWLG
jgi:hypothetical protein